MAGKHIVCPRCHRVNRVPAERFAENPKCGACKAALFNGHPVEVGAGGFRAHVDHSDVPVVVDFWAPWCGPCRAMAPAFAQVAGELSGRVQLVKVNTEAEPALANQFGIRGIPTLVMFQNGREVRRIAGAMDARRLKEWIGPVS